MRPAFALRGLNDCNRSLVASLEIRLPHWQSRENESAHNRDR